MYIFETTYIEFFIKYCTKVNIATISPKMVLDNWSIFVNELEKGYEETPYEFSDDLDINRTYIDTFLFSQELSMFESHKVFCSEVAKIDNLFKSLTIEYPKWKSIGHWTQSRLLKKGSKEYTEPLLHFYKELSFIPKSI